MKKKVIKLRIICLCGITLLVVLYFVCFKEKDSLPDVNACSVAVKNECNTYDIKIKIGNEVDDNAEILINSENLADKGTEENGETQKTEWFPVDPEGKSLTMYGGFNFAKWEFVDASGEKIVVDHSNQMFNDTENTTLGNKSVDTVSIPEKAIKARVIYFKENSENKIGNKIVDSLKGIMKGDYDLRKQNRALKKENDKNLLREELYISYGDFPSSACEKKTEKYKLPKVLKGDMLVYNTTDHKWKIKRDDKEIEINGPELELHEGYTITVEGVGNNCIHVDDSDKKNANKNGEYGVRYKRNGTSIVCERVGDAKYMHTNFLNNNEMMGIYENDFDEIYPWSQMKTCYIDSKGNVYYDVPKDKEILDEMIEIPKFYFKREIKNEFEYLFISKDKKEGYEIHPAFVTETGICDSLYIGAYLSSIYDTGIVSRSGIVPLIDLSVSDLQKNLNKKGTGWEELDLVTLNMIQSLWLVETGVKNTQSIFEGYTEAAFIWSDDSDPKYAQESQNDTNVIKIIKNDYTQKFSVNDYVIVDTFKYVDKSSAYLDFTKNYKNDDINWQRKIVDIKEEEEFLNIEFSGPAINVVKGSTIIANLPECNGLTDGIQYHSGSYDGIEGKTSFKYRGMENLWGNVCTILDNSYVENNKLTIIYPDNKKVEIACNIPTQSKGGSVAKGNEAGIKTMCFDELNPTIFFPEIISNGANLSNSFGDWFCWVKEDTHINKSDNSRQYLTYGMTWDLSAYAGLFGYRVFPTVDMRKVEHGSRILYRKKKVK